MHIRRFARQSIDPVQPKYASIFPFPILVPNSRDAISYFRGEITKLDRRVFLRSDHRLGDCGIEVVSQRRRVVQLGSWDCDLEGCFFGLAFERLRGCRDDLVEASLAFGDHQWVS